MLEKLDNVLFFKGHVNVNDINSGIVKFFTDNMDLANIDLSNISSDYDNFDEDDPETIIYVRFMAWCNRFKQLK